MTAAGADTKDSSMLESSRIPSGAWILRSEMLETPEDARTTPGASATTADSMIRSKEIPLG